MKNIDVSVVIVNYNTLIMTQECIDSIFKVSRNISFEVILVDNASTDGSKEHFSTVSRSSTYIMKKTWALVVQIMLV